MVLPPTTLSQLSHTLIIRVTGQNIGAINEWNPRQNRTFTDLYEFGPVTGPFFQNPGEPFEVVPGNVSGLQIDSRRWDQYTARFETAFGTPDLTMLSNQFTPITIRAAFASPGNTNNFARVYRGVWLQDIGRPIDAKGDRTINAGGTWRYTRRDLIPV